MHAFEGQLLSLLLVGRPSRERVDPLRLSTRRETGLKMLHATWSWDKGSASTSVLHYCPYPDEISKKIEECYLRLGPNHFECDVGGGRVVTKTHKGLVQHVKGEPGRWRAVRRVVRSAGAHVQPFVAAPPPAAAAAAAAAVAVASIASRSPST